MPIRFSSCGCVVKSILLAASCFSYSRIKSARFLPLPVGHPFGQEGSAQSIAITQNSKILEFNQSWLSIGPMSNQIDRAFSVHEYIPRYIEKAVNLLRYTRTHSSRHLASQRFNLVRKQSIIKRLLALAGLEGSEVSVPHL